MTQRVDIQSLRKADAAKALEMYRMQGSTRDQAQDLCERYGVDSIDALERWVGTPDVVQPVAANFEKAERKPDMTPQELDRLHASVARIKRLDDMLERMARNPEDKLDELGEKVISVLGRNVIDKRKDWVGEVTWVALFNAILKEREELRESLKGQVDISESIHKVQQVQEQT